MDENLKNRVMFGAFPRGVDTHDLLAAVGRNTGSSSDYGYVLGHGLAAEILFRALGRGHGGSRATAFGASAYVDAIIYPLCYCIRHFVELSLKDAIRRIRTLRGERTASNNSHSLKKILAAFTEACQRDRRLGVHAVALGPLVDAVASVDPTGQAFRYRANLDGEVHHHETAVIHVRSTERMFKALRRALRHLDELLEQLEWEYHLGTYTSKLSRADLLEIAKLIKAAYDPGDKSWMKKIRAQVRREYGLSDSDFDAADDLIEKNRLLSNVSGIERPLKEVTARTMAMLPWAVVAFPEDDLLSADEWKGLAGIASVMLPQAACEDYEWVLQSLADGSVYLDKGHIARKILHQPDRVLDALRKLGQPTLAAAFSDS